MRTTTAAIRVVALAAAAIGFNAHADIVTEWSDKLSAAAYVVPGGPAIGTRLVAMGHVAMFLSLIHI